MLIHNSKMENLANKYRFKRCKDNNCSICGFSSEQFYLKANGFILPIMSNSKCTSQGCVYIIKCRKCSVYYIGESGRKVIDRIIEHIQNIKRFQKNLNVKIATL